MLIERGKKKKKKKKKKRERERERERVRERRAVQIDRQIDKLSGWQE